MVPEGWKFSKIRDLPGAKGRPTTKLGPFGSAIKKSDYRPSGYKVYGQQQVLAGDETYGDYWIDDRKFAELEACSVLPGDVLISTMGSFGSVLCLSDHAAPGVINPRLLRLSVSPEVAYPRYLEVFLKSDLAQKQFVAFAQGGTMQAVNGAGIGALMVPLPPLPEQQKIAEILSTWDKAIETTEALLANARTQKRALMQSLLTGTRRFPGFEDQPWIEEKLEKLEEMRWVKLGRGNVISKKDIEANPGEYPIYSSSVVGDGMFGRYGSYMFDEEMITWSVDGGGHFFHRKRHRFSVTNVCGWMRADPTKLHYGFLAAQLQNLHARLEFNYQSKAHPSVIRSIYTLVVPSLDEQQLIGQVALEAEEQINLLLNQLDHLRTEKKSLMQQLLTGKRRVVT